MRVVCVLCVYVCVCACARVRLCMRVCVRTYVTPPNEFEQATMKWASYECVSLSVYVCVSVYVRPCVIKMFNLLLLCHL